MAKQNEHLGRIGSHMSITFVALALFGCGDDGEVTSASVGDDTATSSDTSTASSETEAGSDTETETGTGDPYDFFVANQSYADLHGFTLVATGTRNSPGQGMSADAPLLDFTSFEVTLAYDLDADALRVDWERQVHEPIVGAYTFSEVIADRQGYIEGVDNLSFLPPRSMTAQRVAAVRKQQGLLHPAVLLHRAVNDPSAVTVLPDTELDGVPVHLVEFADDAEPVLLFVDVDSGELVRAETTETDHLLGDVVLAANYSDWSEVEGLAFPGRVELTFDGRTIHTQTHTQLELDPNFSADTFALAEPGVEDPAAHQSGDLLSQWHIRFGHLGIPVDGPTQVIMEVEVAPGVLYLLGPTHHSLALELEDGVMLIDPVIDPNFADSILARVEAHFPDKTVTQVLCTHHHFDHIGGVREFAAAGAELLIAEDHLEFLEQIIERPHELVPDSLEQAPVPVTLTPVPASGMTIEGATVTIELYTIPNSHSEGMLAVYLPELQLVFQSDLYSPKLFPPNVMLPEPQLTWSTEFHTALLDLGLEVQTIIGGHGLGVGSLAELVDHIGL